MRSLAHRGLKYLLLALALSLVSIAHAIGFGELKLYSYLGEPLYAEIEITNYEGIDPDILQVGLAGAKDFLRAGIDRPYFLTNLVFQVITYEKKLLIVVRTSKVVSNPYLEFLVEMSWPGGNLIKEYTILFDPPPSDLSYANRQKGYAQKAEDEAKAQAAGETPIQEQMNLQQAQAQKEAAEATLSKVVKDGSKYSDETFAPPPKQPDLVPGVVPDIVDEEAEYAKQRQDFAAEQVAQQAKAPTTLLQKTVAEIDEIKGQAPEVPTTSKEAPKDAAGPKPATTLKPASPTLLTPPKNVSSSEVTASPMPAAVAPGAKPEEEPVDFNQVIKPSGGVKAKPAPPADEPQVVAAPLDTEPEVKPHNHLYLGIILSLLLIAAGLGIAIKRGLLTNILARRSAAVQDGTQTPPPETQTAETFTQNTDEDKLAKAIDEFTATEEETEQIELATTPQTTPTPMQPPKPLDVDLDQFEEEFANINLDELGIPQESPATPGAPTPKPPQPEIPPGEQPPAPKPPQPEITPPTPDSPPQPPRQILAIVLNF